MTTDQQEVLHVCRVIVTGTSMDGGWYYAACTCGWKEGNRAHQSTSDAHDAWRLHVEPEEARDAQ